VKGRFWLLWLLLVLFVSLQCGRQGSGYLNHSPDVKYVGMEACQPCHQSIYDSYIETGMGRSFYRPNVEEVIEEFGAVVHDSFSNYYYYPYWKDSIFYVREFRLKGADTVYIREEKVDYIVGSGHQTRSYIMERNGYFYEFPITWYVSKGIWDLSPGYEGGQNSRFDREIGEECLACHTGHFSYMEGSKNRFQEVTLGIDCEQCHGPGEAHIAKIRGGDMTDVGAEIDYSIVNPKKLGVERQFDVCQQCHLQGINVLHGGRSVRDFRPGEALHSTFDVFIERQANAQAFGIASHAERLMESVCFIQTNAKEAGSFTCTSCHDPHKSIQVTDSMVYIRQCMSCHEEEGCSELEANRMAVGGNCIGCHMLKGGTSDIPHVSFHDHKIRVVRDEKVDTEGIASYLKLVCGTSKDVENDAWGESFLLYYERNEKDRRYLSLADSLLDVDNVCNRGRLAYHQGKYGEAEELVKRCLGEDEEDIDVSFLLGEILEAKGEWGEAYEVYEGIYSHNSEIFEAGLKAVTTMLRAREGDRSVLVEARGRLEALMVMKPFDVRVLTNLGFVYMNERRFGEAKRFLNRALSYSPDNVKALENRIYIGLLEGDKKGAKASLDRLLEIMPDYVDAAGLKKKIEEM